MSHAEIVTIRDDLAWLVPMFESLQEVVDEFLEWDDGEPPYYNTETASMSLIVAAAWRAGYLALADYRRDKWNGSADVNGRCDLIIGKAAEYLEIEAKQRLMYPRSAKKTLQGQLDKACGEAKKLWRAPKTRRAGLLFAVLKISKEQFKKFDRAQLVINLKSVKSDCAWLWLHDSHGKGYLLDKGYFYYPGFAVFIRK